MQNLDRKYIDSILHNPVGLSIIYKHEYEAFLVQIYGSKKNMLCLSVYVMHEY